MGADAMGMKTRMRLRWPIGGGVCLSERNGKKCQKLWKGEVLPLDRSLLMGDFSVVLLRSDFVLFSEKNHVKAHTNPWFLARSYAPECLSGATRRGHTMTPEGQMPSR